jgi:hypothetical protein
MVPTLGIITITDGLLIASTLLSPFLAVFAQKKIEEWRAARQTKLWIFKTLMATRAATLSSNHVQALNMIDLEFSDTKNDEKEVKRIWKEYLDHLTSLPPEPEAQKAAIGPWVEKNQDYLADLLVAMGKCFGYRFDRVDIKKRIYSPEGHARDEAEQRAIRAGLLRILHGQGAILTQTALVPANEAMKEYGAKLQAALLGVLEGQQAIAIRPPQPEVQSDELVTRKPVGSLAIKPASQ